MASLPDPAVHIVIPDTQVKSGVNTTHLSWAGQYIADKYGGQPNVTIIHLGDHWDLPALSSYDKGRKSMEGRRYTLDVNAGNLGFERLNEPIAQVQGWTPRKIFLLGNHEDRITRAAEADPQMEGVVSLDHLNAAALGWEVHPFLQPVNVNGVIYSHYFYNPMSGRPYSGNSMDLRLKTIGHSFTMGHQQTLQYGIRFVGGRSQHGLVAGSFYQHEEDYKGPQGNAHWRGIIVCHQVERGSYDPMFLSIDYLCRRYEGKTLGRFKGRH